jgi:cytochrome b561
LSSSFYRPLQKALHWVTFLLVLGIYGLTYVVDLYPRGDPGRVAIWGLHISFGLALLVLVVLRIIERLRLGAPGLPSSMNGLEALLAHSAHVILYALLLVIPLLGVTLVWLRGDTLSFFGLFSFPALFAPNKELAGLVKEIHSLCANGILIVAGLHAAAALWHHFVRRDDVLQRMLPGDGTPARAEVSE